MCETPCESLPNAAPGPVQKSAPGPAERPAAIACRCGAGPHPTHAHRCAKGHGLPRNALTLKHGAYASRELVALGHAVELAAADTFLVGTIADRGGSEMTTIERGYAGKLAELELSWRLLALDVRRHGILTPSGRPRGAYLLLLQTIDRWDRLAQRLGMGRRPKAIATIEDWLRGAALDDDPAHAHDDPAIDTMTNATETGDRSPDDRHETIALDNREEHDHADDHDR